MGCAKSFAAFPMNISPKTKLALMRSLREKKSKVAQGFTLIELMIVVAIVGILSAVALPNFLGARNAAAAGAAIGEIVGIAKECATFKASGGVGVAPTTGGVTCNTTASQSYSATGGGTVSGLRCLAATSAGASKAVITVATDGGLSCALS